MGGHQINTCLPFSLYLLHGFRSESERPYWNRVKPDTDDSLQFYPTLNIADYDQLLATIRQLKSRPSTAKSPSVSFTLSGVESVATLDEGAEVNCMNLKFAKNVM